MSSNEDVKVNFSKLAPFDSSMSDHLSMYDNLPYQRDPDRCNGQVVCKESGNILKFYRCNIDGAYEVSNQDENTSKMLARLRKSQVREAPAQTIVTEAPPASGGITEEQMDELFRDNEEE